MCIEQDAKCTHVYMYLTPNFIEVIDGKQLPKILLVTNAVTCRIPILPLAQ